MDFFLTPERAKQLLEVQAGFGGSYNANSARLILSEAMKEHGLQAVDELITGLGPDVISRFRSGARFEGGLALDATKK